MIPRGAVLVQLESKDVQSYFGSTLRRLRIRMAGTRKRCEGWVTLDVETQDEEELSGAQFFTGPYESNMRQIRKRVQRLERQRHSKLTHLEAELPLEFESLYFGSPTVC
jgi:hypothetical protein